jgi:heme exporter protein B
VNALRQTLLIARKDLQIEWASPARTFGVFVFALALVVLVGFAVGAQALLMRSMAAGVFWVGLLLASTRSLDRSFALELEHGALERLLLLPVNPLALYYGKAFANLAFLLFVAFALGPIVIALYDVSIRGDLFFLPIFVVLGSASIAAPGTILALITSHARAASVLLPVLLLPLVLPALFAASRGTAAILEGNPMREMLTWLAFLTAFNAIHWTVSGVLFAFLVEEAAT